MVDDNSFEGWISVLTYFHSRTLRCWTLEEVVSVTSRNVRMSSTIQNWLGGERIVYESYFTQSICSRTAPEQDIFCRILVHASYNPIIRHQNHVKLDASRFDSHDSHQTFVTNLSALPDCRCSMRHFSSESRHLQHTSVQTWIH